MLKILHINAVKYYLYLSFVWLSLLIVLSLENFDVIYVKWCEFQILLNKIKHVNDFSKFNKFLRYSILSN
jgi:hypothetical protein